MSEQYQYQEFPRHLHRLGGLHCIVTSEDEKQAKLREGWFLTVAAAEAAIGVDPPTATAPMKPGRKPKA